MPSEIKAEFNLTGINFSPERITSLLGITPSRTWKVGDLIPKTILCMKHDGWSLATDTEIVDDVCDLEKHIQRLLKQLKSSVGKIKEICSRYQLDAEISCVVYTPDANPGICFEPDIAKQIADLGAAIDIDLYFLPSDGESEITK